MQVQGSGSRRIGSQVVKHGPLGSGMRSWCSCFPVKNCKVPTFRGAVEIESTRKQKKEFPYQSKRGQQRIHCPWMLFLSLGGIYIQLLALLLFSRRFQFPFSFSQLQFHFFSHPVSMPVRFHFLSGYRAKQYPHFLS